MPATSLSSEMRIISAILAAAIGVMQNTCTQLAQGGRPPQGGKHEKFFRQSLAAHPAMRREYRSRTMAKWSQPLAVRI